jgi:hypothetical protein
MIGSWPWVADEKSASVSAHDAGMTRRLEIGDVVQGDGTELNDDGGRGVEKVHEPRAPTFLSVRFETC